MRYWDSMSAVEGPATKVAERLEERGSNGRFLPGNQAAVTHGLAAAELPGDLVALRAEVEAFLSATLVDEGDVADIPERRRALLEYRARLHRRVLQLDAAL